MESKNAIRVCVLLGVTTLGILDFARSATAQVTEVVVGVTPTCPYGLSGCWGGAQEGLAHLEGVEEVAKVPDVYNCTAHVYLKKEAFPNLEAWPKQFEAVVGAIQLFRGVEVTVRAPLEKEGDRLVLQVQGPNQKHQMTLGPLRHKLQWNYRKHAARGPEPDELTAYDDLSAQLGGTTGARFEITGPLRQTEKGLVLEVREFFSL